MSEQWPKDTVGICGCGLPLVPCLNSEGIRIGVTHRGAEQAEHHSKYFAGVAVDTREYDDNVTLAECSRCGGRRIDGDCVVPQCPTCGNRYCPACMDSHLADEGNEWERGI